MNLTILSGNLASDVELRTTGSGITKASFRLAVRRNFSNKQGERETDFFDIVAWRQTADFCGKYLTKCRKVTLKGSLQTRTYDASDGSKRHVTEIVAEEVEFADSKPNGAGNAVPAGNRPRQNYGGFTEVDDGELPF